MHEMISARLLAKLEKDCEMTDFTREALREFGVHVDDRKREWCADGTIPGKGESAVNFDEEIVEFDGDQMNFDDEDIHFDNDEANEDDNDDIREDDEEVKEKN